MSDTELVNPPESFPDWATCRVKPDELDDNFECLGVWGSLCSHSLNLGDRHLCRHAAAREILARTEISKDKPDERQLWETRAPGWQIRCLKCGFTEPWGKYGIRKLAAGKSYTIGFCSHCRWLRFHVTEKRPDA